MSNSIACVVLNYNSYEYTIKCVDNILKMGCEVDVVIPDNNSSDESFSILKQKYSDTENIYVIQNNNNVGYSAGNNFGIKHILQKNNNIKYLCIMNPDTCFDEPQLLNRMKTQMEKYNEIAVIAPVMYLREERDLEHSCWSLPNNVDFLKRLFINYKWKGTTSIEYISENLAYVEVVHGSFFMIKRDVLEEMNFFDENIFLYSEENAIGFEIKKMGMKEAVCTDEKFYHNHPIENERLTLKQKISSARIGFRSRLYICKKYYPKYLYPIAYITKTLSFGIIIIEHLLGSLFKRKG